MTVPLPPAGTGQFVFNDLTDTVYVGHDDFRSFGKSPWKCVIAKENGERIGQLWFNRDGTIKAIGRTPDEQGCYWLIFYVKAGKNYDYFETGARLNAKEDVETSGMVYEGPTSIGKFPAHGWMTRLPPA